jgi:hypothetical protein
MRGTAIGSFSGGRGWTRERRLGEGEHGRGEMRGTVVVRSLLVFTVDRLNLQYCLLERLAYYRRFAVVEDLAVLA